MNRPFSKLEKRLTLLIGLFAVMFILLLFCTVLYIAQAVDYINWDSFLQNTGDIQSLFSGLTDPESLGLPGLRYLAFHILANPAILFLILITAVVLILAFFLIRSLFQNLREDEYCLRKQIREEQFNKQTRLLTELEKDLASYGSEQKTRLDETEDRLEKQRIRYENVLHQVRSKPTSLYFYTDYLESSDPEIQKEMAEVLDESDQMIRQALHESIYGSCNLEEIILQILNQKKPELEKQNLTLKTELQTAYIIGDTLWLRQVFESAVSNMLRSSLPGSEIEIRMNTANPFKTSIYLINQIKEPAQGHLYDQRYASLRADDSHFGIGLDLIRKTMEDHQSSIKTLSDENRFELVLEFSCSQLEEIH